MPATALIVVLYFHILSISVVSKHLLTTITCRGFPSHRQWCLTVGASRWATRRRTSLSPLSGEAKPTSSYQVQKPPHLYQVEQNPHHITLPGANLKSPKLDSRYLISTSHLISPDLNSPNISGCQVQPSDMNSTQPHITFTTPLFSSYLKTHQELTSHNLTSPFSLKFISSQLL